MARFIRARPMIWAPLFFALLAPDRDLQANSENRLEAFIRRCRYQSYHPTTAGGKAQLRHQDRGHGKSTERLAMTFFYCRPPQRASRPEFCQTAGPAASAAFVWYNWRHGVLIPWTDCSRSDRNCRDLSGHAGREARLSSLAAVSALQPRRAVGFGGLSALWQQAPLTVTVGRYQDETRA